MKGSLFFEDLDTKQKKRGYFFIFYNRVFQVLDLHI